VKPNGSELDDFFKIIGISLANNRSRLFRKGFFEGAKPSNLAARGITHFRGKPISWTDKLVEDVRRTLNACAMFLWFPIWYLNDGGIGIIANIQAGAMTKGKAATNDVLGNFNPLTIIFFIPLLTYVIYPNLERLHMMPGRITKITFGFTLAWISSVIGAILQWKVYTTHPCGYRATSKSCDPELGVSPLSVWTQVPIFMLGAMSECFCQVTAYEIAYARSPKNMRALVMSIFLFMNALSSIIALIATPALEDPTLVWAWLGPAIAMFVVSVIFYIQYRKMNSDEYMLKAATQENSLAKSPSEEKRV
jgi:dipeptide/tripeptide permease